MRLLIFLLFTGLSTSLQAGKIYKWTDENGQVHYSTFPPVRAPAEQFGSATTKDSKSSSSKQRRYDKNKKHDNRIRKSDYNSRTYERKYGAEAKLRRLEEEKRQQEARKEQAHQQRIEKMERQKRAKEFEKKWDDFEKRVTGIVDKCEADHGTDCNDPKYLLKRMKR